MKRNFKLLAAVVALVMLVMTLASCELINDIIDKFNPDKPCEHQYTNTVTKEATCTEAGEMTLTCSNCGDTKTETIAPGHIEVDIPAKAPTCTEAGLSAGKKCSACDTVLTEQVTLNATGHKYADGVCSACGAEQSTITGSGTEDDPFVLPKLGDYTASYPGGYDLIFYSYKVNANGYATISSDWTGDAWLKAGTNIYNMRTNEGDGSVEVFVTAGSTVYFGVADWNEQPNDVPFTVSFEEVTLGSVEPFVGSWKGDVAGWFGSITYIINIDEDGKGTASADMGYTVADYTVPSVIVIGTTVMIDLVDEYDNVTTLTLEYDATANTLTGGTDYEEGVFSPYTGEDENEPKPEVTYETVIVSGKNTLFFSEAEITGDSATRKLTITEAGVYKFAAGSLFIQSITDANGTAIERDSNYNFSLAAGEYTVTFGMLSMFGVSPDFAYTLEVSVYNEGGNEGGNEGDNEGGNEGGEDEDEYPEFVTDEDNDAVCGYYEITIGEIAAEAIVYQDYESNDYIANIYNLDEGFDLYFSFDATPNGDGSYTLELTYLSNPDMEVGTDMKDTILAYDFVVTPVEVE